QGGHAESKNGIQRQSRKTAQVIFGTSRSALGPVIEKWLLPKSNPGTQSAQNSRRFRQLKQQLYSSPVKNAKIARVNRPGMIGKPVHESIKRLITQIEQDRNLAPFANAIRDVASARPAGFIHGAKDIEGILQIGIDNADKSSRGKSQAGRDSRLMAE